MKETQTPIRAWLRHSTIEDRDELCRLAGTSVGGLYQLSGGSRGASAEMAGRLEHASMVLSASSGGRLPVIYRTELNAACRACDYARRCLGDHTIVASEFDSLRPAKRG